MRRLDRPAQRAGDDPIDEHPLEPRGKRLRVVPAALRQRGRQSLAEILLGLRFVGVAVAGQQQGEHVSTITTRRIVSCGGKRISPLLRGWVKFPTGGRPWRSGIAEASPRPGATLVAKVDALTGSRRSQSGWEKGGAPVPRERAGSSPDV